MSKNMKEIEIIDVSIHELNRRPMAIDSKFEIIVGMINSGVSRIHVGDMKEFCRTDALEFDRFSREISNLRKKCLFSYDYEPSQATDKLFFDPDDEAVFGVSVSESFSRVNRNMIEKHAERELIEHLSASKDRLLNKVRVNVETGFDCPFEGTTPVADVIALIETWAKGGFAVEFCLCDTIGNATPDHVFSLFRTLVSEFSSELMTFSFCPNNIFGFGLSNLMASFHSGVRTFATSLGGFCGEKSSYLHKSNLATEDVVFLFEKMAMRTNIKLGSLLAVVDRLAFLNGGDRINGYVGNLPKNYVLNRVRPI